jgi:phosphotransferase system enzyme I (PtsI)
VTAAGHPSADEIPLGVMIEVPAAAVMADVFARHADFLSIGTNDLVQYAMAIDRTNRALAYLASPFDPAILRLISGVVRAGRDFECPVSVCGEMASEPLGALMLLGLGVRELSMEAVALPEIKEAIRRVELRELEAVAHKGLELFTAVQVEQLVEMALAGRLQDILTGQPDLVPGSGRSPRNHTPAFGMPRITAEQLLSLPATPRPGEVDDDHES